MRNAEFPHIVGISVSNFFLNTGVKNLAGIDAICQNADILAVRPSLFRFGSGKGCRCIRLKAVKFCGSGINRNAGAESVVIVLFIDNAYAVSTKGFFFEDGGIITLDPPFKCACPNRTRNAEHNGCNARDQFLHV